MSSENRRSFAVAQTGWIACLMRIDHSSDLPASFSTLTWHFAQSLHKDEQNSSTLNVYWFQPTQVCPISVGTRTDAVLLGHIQSIENAKIWKAHADNSLMNIHSRSRWHVAGVTYISIYHISVHDSRLKKEKDASYSISKLGFAMGLRLMFPEVDRLFHIDSCGHQFQASTHFSGSYSQ